MIQMFELMKKSPSRILKLFIENPSQEFYAKEVQQKTGVAKASLVSWLNKLVEMGVLTRKLRGRLRIYKLNRAHVWVKQLKVLCNVATLLLAVQKMMKLDVEVYLYGSAARGEDLEDSDIDLLVLGKADPKEVGRCVQAMSREVGRGVRPQIFSKLEWSQVAKSDPAFFERVEKDKIRLI